MTPNPHSPQLSSTPAWLRWLARTALLDVGFWSTLIVLIVVVFMVPQIHNVILQTVETGTNVFGAATLLSAGFLAFLAVLAAAAFASLLYVVPPSFRSQEGRGARPVHLEKDQLWVRLAKAALLVLVLVGGVAARIPYFIRIPHIILILIATLLVFADVRRFVARRSGWLVKVTERTPAAARRTVGALLLAIAALILCTYGARGESSRFYRLAGSACQEFGLLSFLIGGWLIFIPSAVSRENSLGSIRTAQGRLLGWLMGSSLAGELLWILAGGTLTQAWFSYRLYTIWAVLELLVLCVIVASLLDTWQTALQLPIRLIGMLVVVLLFFVTGTPFREVMYPPKAAAELQKQLPENWPGLLQKRIATLPKDDPVVVVASSGGGSRAAIFSTLILEHLARELVRSLPPELAARAVLLPEAPPDLVTANRSTVSEGDRVVPLSGIWRDERFRDAVEWERLQAMSDRIDDAAAFDEDDHRAVEYTSAPKGVSGAQLDAGQREVLRLLLGTYVGRVPDGVGPRYDDAALDAVHVAWAGPTEPGAPHYYRLQGPRLLVEWDNTQRGANHAHSVWRDPVADFGLDVLARHRAAHPH